MIPYSIYKIIHLLGILTVFLSLGGMILHVINGGGRDHRWRNPVLITHGTGILLALLGGFGLLARIGIHWPWPGWVATKFAIWLILGALPAIVIRKSSWAKSFWWGSLILGGTAAYLASQKPF